MHAHAVFAARALRVVHAWNATPAMPAMHAVHSTMRRSRHERGIRRMRCMQRRPGSIVPSRPAVGVPCQPSQCTLGWKVGMHAALPTRMLACVRARLVCVRAREYARLSCMLYACVPCMRVLHVCYGCMSCVREISPVRQLSAFWLHACVRTHLFGVVYLYFGLRIFQYA